MRVIFGRKIFIPCKDYRLEIVLAKMSSALILICLAIILNSESLVQAGVI